jgi:hypothetical protein
VQAPGGHVFYVHHGPRDHEVEPVAMATADVIHVCDFCLGWWAACQACTELVSARQIGKLRDRALAAGVARRGGLTAWERQSVLDQLAAFWLAVPGPPVEIM